MENSKFLRKFTCLGIIIAILIIFSATGSIVGFVNSMNTIHYLQITRATTLNVVQYAVIKETCQSCYFEIGGYGFGGNDGYVAPYICDTYPFMAIAIASYTGCSKSFIDGNTNYRCCILTNYTISYNEAGLMKMCGKDAEEALKAIQGAYPLGPYKSISYYIDNPFIWFYHFPNEMAYTITIATFFCGAVMLFFIQLVYCIWNRKILCCCHSTTDDIKIEDEEKIKDNDQL